MESTDRELNIEISSTSLGNTNIEGGKVGAILGLTQEAISEDIYTNTVLVNALEAKIQTEEIFPNAKFGVSALISAVNPEKIKSLISSIDYPYLVKFNTEFLKEKIEKGKEEGFSGLGLGVAVAQEYAYGLLQSHSAEKQMDSTVNGGMALEGDMVKIRTCIETVSIEEEIKKIREVNKRLSDGGKRVMWAIEPNKKIGDGTFADFMNFYQNIRHDPQNESLRFGIDLDMGGLPKEEYHNVIDIMDHMGGYNLPVYLSLSGKDYTQGSVRTHLTLGDDYEFNKKLGEWFKAKQFRGKNVPAIIVETNPIDNVLEDYKKFLQGFKKGFNK